MLPESPSPKFALAIDRVRRIAETLNGINYLSRPASIWEQRNIQPPQGGTKIFLALMAWLYVYRRAFKSGTKRDQSELTVLSRLHFPFQQTAFDSNP